MTGALRASLVCCVLLLQCSCSWALYGVRLSDLKSTPTPPNPVRVWGRVVSETPVRISDGRAEIQVSGVQASIGEFVVLTGEWDGATLNCGTTAPRRFGPADIEMVWVPAGSFLMGSSGTGPDSFWVDPHECPQHSVYLSGYWIARTEVTRGQYRLFVQAGGYSNPAYWSGEGWDWAVSTGRTQPDFWAAQQNWGTGVFTQTEEHPVVGVTFYEAEAFCTWAGLRLPTEAEWEKAARWDAAASKSRPWAWGDAWLTGACNDYLDSSAAGGGAFKSQTAAVGTYPSGASYYGCHDMMGNVWEWCSDWYDATYYSQTPSGGWRNPTGPATGIYRMARGGGWNDDFSVCRCTKRYPSTVNYARNTYGFRAAY